MGGGTPTLMRTRRLARLMQAIRPCTPGAGGRGHDRGQPGDRRPVRCSRALRRMGVTRVSLGAQSFQPDLLRRTGPAGDARPGPRGAYRGARAAGFEERQRRSAVRRARAGPRPTSRPTSRRWSPWPRTTSPGTSSRSSRAARSPAGRGWSVDEGFAEEAYRRVVERLEGAGYRWYETANFARPGPGVPPQPGLLGRRRLRGPRRRRGLDRRRAPVAQRARHGRVRRGTAPR